VPYPYDSELEPSQLHEISTTSFPLEAVQIHMGMLDLPLEILLQVLDELATEANINALAKTCHHLYTLLNPILYQRNIQNGQSSALLGAGR
jgi:hypothetical protein